jgi:hypothetical protein
VAVALTKDADDADFLKEIGQLLSRDFMPKKRGPKGSWKKKEPII